MTLNSKTEYKNAQNVIPGGVNSPVRAFKSVGGTPLFIKKGKGAYLYDIDDNKYVDFVQSWGPLIFGHCDEDIENEVIKNVKNGLSFGAPTILETKLANEIVNMYDYIDKVRFVSSGTEAVMSAIRLARGVTKKDDIIKFDGCYHGHSDSLLVKAGSGMATFGTPSSQGVPKDFTKHTILCEYNNIKNLEDSFKNNPNISCIIIEPIAGNMGLVPATEDFLNCCRMLCDKYGALLIFDEVMSGFRASLKGASGLVDIQADILVFGKVIGAGMPVGAFASSSYIMDHLSPDGNVYQAGTLSGNPISMSAGLANIKKIKEDTNIYNRLNQKSIRLITGLNESAKKYKIDFVTLSKGSMFGFFFNDKLPLNMKEVSSSNEKRFSLYHSHMLKKGFYFPCSMYEVCFMSNVISNEDIDRCIDASYDIMSIL
jgi:glutamate-1-semialdehyde 2,1-aminomutase